MKTKNILKIRVVHSSRVSSKHGPYNLKIPINSTYDGSGRTIFLLALAAGVDLDFSIAIR